MEVFISSNFKSRKGCLAVHLFANYVRATIRKLVTLTLLTPEEQKNKNISEVLNLS